MAVLKYPDIGPLPCRINQTPVNGAAASIYEEAVYMLDVLSQPTRHRGNRVNRTMTDDKNTEAREIRRREAAKRALAEAEARRAEAAE